jgi:hypothetical protein
MSFDNETFEGADETEPTAKRGKKSQEDVLKALDSEPLEQARKFCQYVRVLKARQARIQGLLSAKAKALVADNTPEYLG